MTTPDPEFAGQDAESSRPPVALIAGPTASGKSALALAVAARRDAVIINADASQVYADLRVLSARPGAQEMARAPHRLFGHIDGAEACSAARWAGDARREIAAAHAAGRLPVLVGGTGLYLRTLLDGIAPIPEIDPQIRAEVRAMETADAYGALTVEDEQSAARLAPADSSRIARALEVVRSTGRPLGYWHGRKAGGIGGDIRLSAVILLPPRQWLYDMCDSRFEAMLETGAVDEVERLMARGLSPELPVMRAIGVREIAAWRRNEIGREEILQKGRIATRQYAKRQYTWFSHQPPPRWTRETRQIDAKIIEELAIKLQH